MWPNIESRVAHCWTSRKATRFSSTTATDATATFWCTTGTYNNCANAFDHKNRATKFIRIFSSLDSFVYPDNQQDSVVVRLGLSTTDPLFVQRTRLLVSLDIQPHTELLVQPAPQHISAPMLAFVRVFNMSAAQLDYWLADERVGSLRSATLLLGEADIGDSAGELNVGLDAKVWTFLRVRFTLLLAAFTTTLADDEATMEAQRRGQHKLGFVRSILVQYRLLERRMLAAALEFAVRRAVAATAAATVVPKV